MKNIILLFSTLLFGSFAFADLGVNLPIANNQSGKPAFGAQFTYGDDPDGKNYVLTLTPDLPPSSKSQTLLWNFYVSGSDFLMKWYSQRQTSLAVIQVAIKDPSVVEVMLKNQAVKDGQNTLFFVLADPSSLKPVYFVPISTLCATMPTHFVDLTNGKRCDHITNP